MIKNNQNQIAPPFETRSDESGFALILTLWVSAILSCLLLTFSMRVSANLRASSYHLKETNAYYLARGGIYKVASELVVMDEMNEDEIADQIKGKKLRLWSVDPEEWTAKKIDEAPDVTEDFIQCEVSAEDAKLPLDKMTKAMLAKYPEISPVQTESLADFIKKKSKDKSARLLFSEEIINLDLLFMIVD